MPKTDWEAKLDLVLRRSCYTRQYQNVLQLLREFQAEAVGIAKQEALDAKRYCHPCCVHTANCVVVSIESMLPPAKKDAPDES